MIQGSWRGTLKKRSKPTFPLNPSLSRSQLPYSCFIGFIWSLFCQFWSGKRIFRENQTKSRMMRKKYLQCFSVRVFLYSQLLLKRISILFKFEYWIQHIPQLKFVNIFIFDVFTTNMLVPYVEVYSGNKFEMLVTNLKCWLLIVFIEKVSNKVVKSRQHLKTVTINKL